LIVTLLGRIYVDNARKIYGPRGLKAFITFSAC